MYEKVAEAALAALVERVVLVSSAMVHPQNKWHPIRFILNNFITGFSGPVLFFFVSCVCMHVVPSQSHLSPPNSTLCFSCLPS